MSLQARSVSSRIGAKTILERVDFEATSGVVTAIIGPNGAGKSSLLRILGGLRKPSSGAVTVNGRSVDDIPLTEMSRLRGFMASDPPGAIDFGVREVVTMGRHPWASTRQESDSAVERSIEEMELGQLADQPFSTLSTGEAKRTQVARLLAQEVPIMLADEPVNGLDIAYSEMVLDSLRSAARDNRTVVCVLHDLNAAAQYADHIVLMDKGAVVAAGSPTDVLTETLLSEVYRYPVEVFDHPVRPGLAVLAGEDPQSGSQH